MRKLSTIVTNRDSASTGFSDGKLRDNPGNDTGSGVMSAWGNDIWYALRAIVKKYSGTGDVSDSPESENNHDVLDAIEQMMGLSVYGVDAYDSLATYSTAGESVMYAGIQFVNILPSGNTNKDPLTEHDYWLPVPDSRYLFLQSTQGIPQWGASHPLHDFNKATAYRQYFGLGTHRIGGYNGTTFNAYGVHLDGQAIGGSGTPLSDIVEAWHLKNVWMPGSVGTRVAVDAKGTLLRAIDAAGGQAETLAERLEDQMQQITGEFGIDDYASKSGHYEGVFTGRGDILGTFATRSNASTGGYNPILFDSANSPSARTGTTTRDKSVTGGVPYMVVMIPA